MSLCIYKISSMSSLLAQSMEAANDPDENINPLVAVHTCLKLYSFAGIVTTADNICMAQPPGKILNYCI